MNTLQHDERDVLLKAASIVEEGWWQKKKFFRGSEEILGTPPNVDLSNFHCAVTAIAAADRELNGFQTLAYSAAFNRLSRCVGGPVTSWNDTPGRTADEVAEALRKAAE